MKISYNLTSCEHYNSFSLEKKEDVIPVFVTESAIVPHIGEYVSLPKMFLGHVREFYEKHDYIERYVEYLKECGNIDVIIESFPSDEFIVSSIDHDFENGVIKVTLDIE